MLGMLKSMIKRKYQSLGFSDFIGCTEWIDADEGELFEFCSKNIVNR